MGTIILLIRWAFQLLTLIVFVDVLLSYILPPYNQVRLMLDKIVNPLLNPIRRIVPTIGMIDFSPVILLIIIQVVENILVSVLTRIG